MNLDAALAQLAHDPEAPVDLAELALTLVVDEYPDLDIEAYLSELDAMAYEARAYLRGGLEAWVAGLCRYLFHDQGFRGNVLDYYDPRNSYLNQVMDRRTGLPITLSVMAMQVGARAGLEIVGIGLPGHFVVKAIGQGEEVLFDPFHGGRRLTPEQCEPLVQRATGHSFQATPENLQALPVGSIVLRLLVNLRESYFRKRDMRRATRVIERLHQLAPHDLHHRRDLGLGFLHAGQPQRAIDHLTAYLKGHPNASDVAMIRKFLSQAWEHVARWN